MGVLRCSLMYCPKCGNLTDDYLCSQNYVCVCCKTKLLYAPKEYAEDYWICNDIEERTQRLREELVKTSPEFDQYLFDHREEILQQIQNKNQADYEAVKAWSEGRGGTPKCPSCGSTNISKIGTINRAVSTGIFGLASSKIGKTHKCNNCGTTW